VLRLSTISQTGAQVCDRLGTAAKDQARGLYRAGLAWYNGLDGKEPLVTTLVTFPLVLPGLIIRATLEKIVGPCWCEWGLSAEDTEGEDHTPRCRR